MKVTEDTLLVGFSQQSDRDHAVLIVGKNKKGVDVDIINAFQGEEAIELYERLITRKGGKDGRLL